MPDHGKCRTQVSATDMPPQKAVRDSYFEKFFMTALPPIPKLLRLQSRWNCFQQPSTLSRECASEKSTRIRNNDCTLRAQILPPGHA